MLGEAAAYFGGFETVFSISSRRKRLPFVGELAAEWTEQTPGSQMARKGGIMGASVWDLPIGLANQLYRIAYVVVVLGALFTGVATIMLRWTTSLRDKNTSAQIAKLNKFLEQTRAHNQQLVNDNLKLQYKLQIQTANTHRPQLQTQSSKPRQLENKQINILKEAIRAKASTESLVLEIRTDESCADCSSLSHQLRQLAEAAGAIVINSTAVGGEKKPPSGLGITLNGSPRSRSSTPNWFVNALSEAKIYTAASTRDRLPRSQYRHTFNHRRILA
jgi:hypothetical protein